MNKKKVATIVGIIIYGFIQIPVAILGIRGIYLQDILNNRKEVILPEIKIDLGKRQLYDFTTGKEFGEIEILENGDDYFIADIRSEEIEGMDNELDGSYIFKEINEKKIEFKKSEYKDQRFWESRHGDTFFVIFRLDKDMYYGVPDSIRKDGNIMFYLTQIDEDTYNFYIRRKTSVPMNNALQNSMFRSKFSAYF